MKTRLQEIEELLESNKIWDWIGDLCEWDREGMKNWEDKIMDIVKLEIEKHDILKNTR